MRGHDTQNKAWAEAQDERRYMQETRRAAAAAHQRQLWKQQKEKRMNRKGARAQMLLAQAFDQHGGKPPEGEAMEKLVEATKCSPTEIEGWFKYTKRQKQERDAAMRWGADGGVRATHFADSLIAVSFQAPQRSCRAQVLQGAGADDALLRRVDEAEREVRQQRAAQEKLQKTLQVGHDEWVDTWGGEAPTAAERKQMGGEEVVAEPPLYAGEAIPQSPVGRGVAPSAGTAAAALLEQRRLQRVEAAAAERKQASGSKSPMLGRRGGVASFAAVDGADADAENAVRRPPHWPLRLR